MWWPEVPGQPIQSHQVHTLNEEWGISHLVAWSRGLNDTFQRNPSFSDPPTPLHNEVLRRESEERDTNTRECSFKIFPSSRPYFSIFVNLLLSPSSTFYIIMEVPSGFLSPWWQGGKDTLHKHKSTNEKPCGVNTTSVLFRDNLILVPISTFQKGVP